jgi:hypothetical protein
MRRISTLVRTTVIASALVFAAASSSSSGSGGTNNPSNVVVPTQPAGDPNAVVSTQYDVRVAVAPGGAEVKSGDDGGWQMTATPQSNRAIGVSIFIDASGQDTFALAQKVADDRRTKGEDVSTIEADQLLGLPAARWITVSSPDQIATMFLLARSGRCVYLLVANATGTQDDIVNYFKWARGAVTTLSGGAAYPAACR